METLEPGALIAGKYELKAMLGRGGMGTVWRARHRDLGKDVALKLLNPELAQDAAARQRFLQEVESTTAFIHKNAVQLRDFGDDGGRLYFTMDLVEGHTLSTLLRGGPLAPARAVRLICQVLDVLEEAHAAGLVHRDLKPANLIVTPDDDVRVLDFGIAKAANQAGQGTGALTLTGMTVGTLTYMSPEQARGARLDGRSDLYSLGVVLYESLCGELPIGPDPDAEDSKQSLIFNLTMAPPRPLRGAPQELAQVVMRTLAKTPEERWPDARALREALLACPTPSPTLAPPVSPRPPELGTESHRPTGGAVRLHDPYAKTVQDPAHYPATRQAAAHYPPTRVEPTQPTRGRGLLVAALVGVVLLVGALGLGLLYALNVGGLRAAVPAPSEASTATPPPQYRLLELSPAGELVTRERAVSVSGRLEPPGRGDLTIQGVQSLLNADGTFSGKTLTLREGVNRVEIVFRPEAGDPVSHTLSVVHDRTPPQLTLDAPTEGTETLEASLAIRGTASDPRLVSVRVGDRVVSSKAGPFSSSFPLGAAGKATQVTVRAVDAAGNEATIQRRVRRILPKLAIQLASPEPNAWLGRRVPVTGRVTGLAPGQVTLRIQGLRADLGENGRFVKVLDFEQERAHTVTVSAEGRGARTTVRRTFRVDLSPPQVKLSPAIPPTVTSDSILFRARVLDAGPWVNVFLNDRKTRVARGQLLLKKFYLRVGTNRIRLKAYDAAGNSGRERVIVIHRREPTLAWQRYTSRRGRYSALFPGRPQPTSPARDGSRMGVIREHGSIAMVVAYSDRKRGKSARKALDARFRAMTKGKKVLQRDRIRLRNYPGLEFQYRTGKFLLYGRMYLVGRRLYQVLIVEPGGKLKPSERRKFLGSFRLVR